MEVHLRTTGCRLPYGITQCFLPPDTSEHTPTLTPASEGWYSIYLPKRDGRLSWPRWLVTYRDGSPAHRRSPIQVLTDPGVDRGSFGKFRAAAYIRLQIALGRRLCHFRRRFTAIQRFFREQDIIHICAISFEILPKLHNKIFSPLSLLL